MSTSNEESLIDTNEIRSHQIKDQRDKLGCSGKKVLLETNYFRLIKTPSWAVNQYRVDFVPDIELINVRRRVLAEHRHKLGGYIFDGTILFTIKRIEEKQIETSTKVNGELVSIIVKHVGVLKTSEAQYLQVLNLILRRSMEGLNLNLVGRNFFDAIAKIKIHDYKIELWPGYITSIRQHQHDILLCAEITHKIMRMETVFDIFNNCVHETNDYQEKFKKIIVGMIVLTDYNNKTYRIDDIDYNVSPLSTFSTKDGNISYLKYYKNRYGINIRNMNQPLLISLPSERQMRAGNKEPIVLIPELSRATGLSESMRNNFHLMRALSDKTRLSPNTRIERLKNFNSRLVSTKDSLEVLNSWNLDLDKNLVQIEGRILNREKIIFGGGVKVQISDQFDWTREFKGKSVFESKPLKRWKCITTRRAYGDCCEFVKALKDVAFKMSVMYADPEYVLISDEKSESYIRAIEKACNSDIQLIMTVVPNSNAERYGYIKKKCYVDRSIPSQVVVHKTICPREGKSVGLVSVATKVAIQMAAKLSGAPWMIELPLNGLMTVGFDVCHSSYGSSQSIGALVASMDLKQSTSYFSAVSQHLRGQELSIEIAGIMSKAISCYRDIHSCLPSRIIFYRDGVGDGQLHQVMEIEVQNLIDKLKYIYERSNNPNDLKVAFIIVSKRINTRFFQQKNNPIPGTIVDNTITMPDRFDFFLVSQSVRQGTVSPTSYNVIHDDTGLSPDKLQILSYKLCHLYYNWSGTTRVPALCQYAHKLAFLVAQSIRLNPSMKLERYLYFL